MEYIGKTGRNFGDTLCDLPERCPVQYALWSKIVLIFKIYETIHNKL